MFHQNKKDTFSIIFTLSHSAVKPLQIVYLKDIKAFVKFGVWGVKCATINSL